MKYEIAMYRRLGLTPREVRRAADEYRLRIHNRRVAEANMPKRGLDYEAMQKRTHTLAASVLESLSKWSPRPYAPAAQEQTNG